MLRCRKRQVLPNEWGVVFTSPTGLLRDLSNTQADLRDMFQRISYPWVTSHVFRKAAATLLDDAGMTARKIADQLGQAQVSVTRGPAFRPNGTAPIGKCASCSARRPRGRVRVGQWRRRGLPSCSLAFWPGSLTGPGTCGFIYRPGRHDRHERGRDRGRGRLRGDVGTGTTGRAEGPQTRTTAVPRRWRRDRRLSAVLTGRAGHACGAEPPVSWRSSTSTSSSLAPWSSSLVP